MNVKSCPAFAQNSAMTLTRTSTAKPENTNVAANLGKHNKAMATVLVC